MQRLEERSVLKISGNDAKVFLQGLLTNDLTKLEPEILQYSLMLTPQGRILADFFIKEVDQGFLVDLPKSQKTTIIAKLKIYKLKSDVHFHDMDEFFGVFVAENTSMELLKDCRSNALGYRGFLELRKENEDNFFEYHQKRIEHAIPDFDMDMESGKSLPIDFDMSQLNAISFNKGCYVGQEVTAVTHNRGTKRKKVYSANCIDGEFPKKNTDIVISEMKIGVALGSIKEKGLLLLNIEECEKLENMMIKTDPYTLRLNHA